MSKLQLCQTDSVGRARYAARTERVGLYCCILHNVIAWGFVAETKWSRAVVQNRQQTV